MEEITNIPSLSKRRECKAMIQATKYQCLQDHPMSQRMKQRSSGRLKRSSFAYETRALQRKYQDVLPKLVKPIETTLTASLCAEKTGNITIHTSVPQITAKNEQSDLVKKNTHSQYDRRTVSLNILD